MVDLENLVVDIKLLIIDHLLIDNSFHPLSRVNTTFRNILAPHVFGTLRLRNTESSGNYAKFIANGPYARYVKALHYRGIVDWIVGSQDEPLDSKFPLVMREVLESLCVKYPNVKTLRMDMSVDEEEIRSQFHEMEFALYDSAASERELKEGGWYKHVREAYAAISRNPAGQITTLKMVEVPPIRCSSWGTLDFQAFLGGLEDFDLSLCGGDNGAGWMMSTNEPFSEFTSDISDIFFKHLTSATGLSLRAHESGPLGIKIEYPMPVLYHPKVIPHLTSLTLEYYFLDDKLLALLHAHRETLSTLHLTHCYCSDPYHVNYIYSSDIIHWSTLFQQLSSKSLTTGNPTFRKVSVLVIEPLNIFDNEAFETQSEYGEEDLEQVEQEMQECGPWRRAFAYAEQDDKYGFLWQQTEWEIERFKGGEDWREYAKCMEVVEENRKRKDERCEDTDEIQ